MVNGSTGRARIVRPGVIIRNFFNGQQFRVGPLIGSGGSGSVYRVVQTGGRPLIPGECCLKISHDPIDWHREAYFGELLRNEAGVIRVHESFASMPIRGARSPLYCLITEYADGGDLHCYLRTRPTPWAGQHARREITRLLRTVMCLHGAGGVHRDITPKNVFVVADGRLKLGDFGIASHRSGKHHVLADCFNPAFAPKGIEPREKGTWQPADDVYQLGQILAMLLCGSGELKLTTLGVKQLHCSPQTKAIIQRCIGQRRNRFRDAEEMLKALQQEDIRQVLSHGVVRSLKGKRVVFTGPLSVKRAEATRLVERAGGTTQGSVTHLTDILIVGKDSRFWKADTKGQKLLDLDRELERGKKIRVIDERQFRRLVGAIVPSDPRC